MDTSLIIRATAGVLSAIVLAAIVYRRKQKA
jgi:hypothetical protein